MDKLYRLNFMSLLPTGQFKKKIYLTKRTSNSTKTLRTMKTNKKYIKSNIMIIFDKIRITNKIIIHNKKLIMMFLI